MFDVLVGHVILAAFVEQSSGPVNWQTHDTIYHVMQNYHRYFSLSNHWHPALSFYCSIYPRPVVIHQLSIFDAGAGRYPGPGDYTEACFVVFGKGQFRPGQSANPYIGNAGELEHTEEAKVETVCVGEETVRSVIAALKK